MQTLILKDVEEQLPAIIVLGILFAGLEYILALSQLRSELSVFASLVKGIALTGPIAAYVFTHGIIAREYSAQTFHFLDGLPISRHGVTLAKLIVTLGLTLFSQIPLLVVGFVMNQEPWTSVLPALPWLMACVLFFVSFVHAVFFAISFLGRYRIPLLLLSLVALWAVDALTELDLKRFGPFALLDLRFGRERDGLPTAELLVTFTSALFLWLVGLILSLLHEGAMASLLAHVMSLREKVFSSVVIIIACVAVGTLHERTTKKPFDLSTAAQHEGSNVLVKVGRLIDSSEAGDQTQPELGNRSESDASGKLEPPSDLEQHIATHVHRVLVDVITDLGIEGLPPLFLVPRRDLSPELIEVGELKHSEGILLRFRPSRSPGDIERLDAMVIRQALHAHSSGRVLLERHRWLLDGFALLRARRGRATSAPDDRDLVLRALYARARGFEFEDLRPWLSTRERLGEGIAEGAAWSFLFHLETVYGSDRLKPWLQTMLGTKVPNDVRALWQTPRLESEFQETFGVSLEDAFGSWIEYLRELETRYALELERIPVLRGQLTVTELSPRTRRVQHQLTGYLHLEKDHRVQFRWVRLKAVDVEIRPEEVDVEDHSVFDAQISRSLPHTFVVGDRLAFTYSHYVEMLGCSVISGWKREEIR